MVPCCHRPRRVRGLAGTRRSLRRTPGRQRSCARLGGGSARGADAGTGPGGIESKLPRARQRGCRGTIALEPDVPAGYPRSTPGTSRAVAGGQEGYPGSR
ncbi:MAG: hypothetical protein AMS18_11395 [Gemmatimonas sp. SG8_17]|nr:MAG: hypothetical protein AMS18_11395 [Gemmatimonas sp. SG8_17]